MAAAAPPNSSQPVVHPRSHVGFDSITSQIERKLLKRGFQFNVICVGELTIGSLISCRFFFSLVELF
jgi:septin family protein